MPNSNMSRAFRSTRNQKGASEISEFIPSLYILFLITFLPLINIGFLFVCAAVQYLAANDSVSKAATQSTYASALNSMATEAYHFQSAGLAKFVTLAPQGGYVGCGDDLYVQSTNVASGAVTNSPANQPLSQAIDTGSNVYELSVKSVYSVSPLINLASVPILGDVPGLGRPVTLAFSASRPVEHPGGLSASAGSGTSGSNNITAFNRINNPGGPGTVNSGTWNNPTIYSQIQAAGETVISTNVFIVKATNPSWTSSGLNVAPGQKVWIDTQAVGQWSVGPLQYYPLTNANGYPYVTAPNYVAPSLPDGALLGQCGTTGTPFLVGVDKYNYPATTGLLSMICNDGEPDAFSDNSGAQMVRVIVAQ